MELDIGENKISIKQNASGFWYCTDMTVYCISIIDGIALTDRAIDEMIKVLEVKNDPENKSRGVSSPKA